MLGIISLAAFGAGISIFLFSDENSDDQDEAEFQENDEVDSRTPLLDVGTLLSDDVPLEDVENVADIPAETELDQIETPMLLLGTGEADTLVGTDQDDIIIGSEGSDVIYGRDGNDTIIAGDDYSMNDGAFPELNQGENTVSGGAGDDLIVSSTGMVELGDGEDTIVVGAHGDLVVTDFDPDLDKLEVLWDTDPSNTIAMHDAEPTVRISPLESGAGLEVFVNGERIAELRGVSEDSEIEVTFVTATDLQDLIY